MENFEDDDDTHFCNKCHSTIGGLENYVRHRQTGCCRATGEDKSEDFHCAPSTPNVSYPEILNADAFFSSLELRSSAKTHPRRSTDLLDSRSSRRSGRHEERGRKRRRKDKSPDDKDEGKEKQLSSMLPVVSDLDDLALPSLVGFPEIVATASTTTGKATISCAIARSKQTSPGGSTMKLEAYGAKHEGSEQLERKPDQEHDDHRHPDDWLEDTMLEDLEEKEPMRESHLVKYEDYDYQQEEESDNDTLDEEAAEEDSYSSSDDADAHDREYPPRGHTGGKWQPGGIAQDEVVGQLNEDDMELEESEHHHHHHHHHHDHPPPSYTGGKWKPTESAVQKCDVEYDSNKETSSQPPPPSHTRGKWIPGARADVAGATGYWCSPCGRKLASRLVYDRHLLSDLHARRSVQEIDGAAQMPRGGMAGLLQQRQQHLSERQKILALKKSSEASEAAPSAEDAAAASKPAAKGRLRIRAKEVLTCEMCRARVRRGQMGKHLLSHYHCRVAGATPSDAKARRFLLENMANVVRQCPFQCAPCRFYCNTEDTFLRHWRSDAHKRRISEIEGSFTCALCDFWCDDNESVEAHIMKQGHQDVVSMINGSVPIVIRRQRVLTCSTCCRRFRYNIQLRCHARETGHTVDHSASNEYQERISCGACGQIVRSPIALQRHQLACHTTIDDSAEATTSDAPTSLSPYYCSFCSLTFKTAHDAVIHRRSFQHKEAVRARKSESSMTRVCDHCGDALANLEQYKAHLLEKHVENCHRCAKCGERFALSQDVTRHTRRNRCFQRKGTSHDDDDGRWSCSDCSFASESEAEFLFHKTTLHSGPDSADGPAANKYPCPLCEGSYAKTTLRDHLRKHTGERPFACGGCGASFARRSAARIHRKECGATSSWQSARERKYVCSECDAAFYAK